jgi:hypothetical protein
MPDDILAGDGGAVRQQQFHEQFSVRRMIAYASAEFEETAKVVPVRRHQFAELNADAQRIEAKIDPICIASGKFVWSQRHIVSF